MISHDNGPRGPGTAPEARRDGLSSGHALSSHTGAAGARFAVQGRDMNAGCQIPGNPFWPGLVLHPNEPGEQPPQVTFGPIAAEQIDVLSCLFVLASSPECSASQAVSASVLAKGAETLAQASAVVSAEYGGVVTLRFDPPPERVVRLSLSVERGDGVGSHEGGRTPNRAQAVKLHYLVGYRDNALMRLFNAARSDKGSEVCWGGEHGFPHLYGISYDALFSPLRNERFALLEIGLDAATYAGGRPADAPSLRVWREYFPRATLYGYDLHDFSFLDQRDTHLFQGDQSSRADLSRFVESAGRPQFRVVLDDGSHASSHQQISLAALFEHVEPGGMYIIEDLDWQPFAETPTTRQVLQGFIEHRRLETPFLSESERWALEAAIDRVELRRPNDFEFALVTKKAVRPG